MSARTVAIAAGSPETATAGAQIARNGGNAVDIAVGAALTATVAEILMTSLAGSGFLMIHVPGCDAELIDGADAMPSIPRGLSVENLDWRLARIPYGDGIEVMAGHASVGVPGFLAALELAWQRHGSLPWAEIVAPALEQSRRPYPAGPTLASWLDMAGPHIFQQQSASRECFYPRGDQPVREGEMFRVPDLDQTLELIQREGARAFYEGDIAAVFDREMRHNGGLLTRSDLAAHQALVRKPLTLRSAGFQLALNPPPAVGGTAVGALVRMIERAWPSAHFSAERDRLQARAQTMLLQFRDREFVDPQFGDAFAHELLEAVHLRPGTGKLESPNTTHLSVATADGSLVAVTMSMGYGSGVTIPGTGIACANSLGEPELNPHGYHRAPAGSRLISNMAPTLAWHRDGRCLGMGSPGASRITTSIAQTWTRYGLQGFTLEEAVAAPRLHVEQWHDGLRVQCEPEIDDRLLRDDYIVRRFESPNMFFGAIKLAGLDGQRRLHAIADERRHGGVEIV